MFRIKVFILLIMAIQSLSLSGPGDIVGKLAVVYQVAYTAKGDESPIRGWLGWCNNKNCSVPNAQNFQPKLFPDTREYKKLYPTELPKLGNDRPASLFSIWDDTTLDVQFSWIYNYSIEVVSIYRGGWWISNVKSFREFQDSVCSRMLKFSEFYYRKFYITWMLTGWDDLEKKFIKDFKHAEALLFFEARGYARQNGKPVISIHDFHNHDAVQVQRIVDYVKSKGFYVIGGVPYDWRTNDRYENFQDVYRTFDMIQPGVIVASEQKITFCSIDGAKEYQKTMRDDLKFLTENNIDYQISLFPGFIGKDNDCRRMNGDFYWQQFVNLREVGIKNAIISTFNNLETGTAIAKIAEDASMKPVGTDIRALDADGQRLSSDFYLQLTSEGNRMMNGQIALRQSHNISYSY